MNLKPLHDRLIIEPVEETTSSGIVIPDTAKDKPKRGKVLAVGTGIVNDGKVVPLTVKKDDIVLFKEYSPEEVKINGKDYLIIKEEDVLAIVK